MLLLPELFELPELLSFPASVPVELELLHATPNATLPATARRTTPRPRIFCLLPFMKNLLIRYA